MMIRSVRASAPLATALCLTVALAGCQRLGYGDRPGATAGHADGAGFEPVP